jgi:hypothetical protein
MDAPQNIAPEKPYNRLHEEEAQPAREGEISR